MLMLLLLLTTTKDDKVGEALRSCPATKKRSEEATCFICQKQEFSKLTPLPSNVHGPAEDYQEA